MTPESRAAVPTLRLSVEEARQTFALDDVTDCPAALAGAFDLVVQRYLPLSSLSLDPAVVRRDVCDDDYHRHGLARTLALSGRHPESGEHTLLGTMRLHTGSAAAAAAGLPPLETMHLMAPPGGWEQFRSAGFDVTQVAEGARLAVAPGTRLHHPELGTSFADAVLRALVEGTYRFASREYGKTQLWGVLPYYVIARLEHLGMQVVATPEVRPRPVHAALFDRYDRYWRQASPVFCRVG